MDQPQLKPKDSVLLFYVEKAKNNSAIQQKMTCAHTHTQCNWDVDAEMGDLLHKNTYEEATGFMQWYLVKLPL